MKSGIGKEQYLFSSGFQSIDYEVLYTLYTIIRILVLFKGALISKGKDNFPSIFFFFLIFARFSEIIKAEKKIIPWFSHQYSVKGFNSITFSNVSSTR